MDAEDILSQSMLKAWEKTGSHPESIHNFKSWAYKLTYHVWIDRQRKQNRLQSKLLYFDEAIATNMRSPMQEDITNRLQQDEEMQIVQEAIQKLPSRIRQTFILHYNVQMSYQEIAQVQNISYANVRKRISQARSVLKAELLPYFFDR